MYRVAGTEFREKAFNRKEREERAAKCAKKNSAEMDKWEEVVQQCLKILKRRVRGGDPQRPLGKDFAKRA
jgi:hypothetical protein